MGGDKEKKQKEEAEVRRGLEGTGDKMKRQSTMLDFVEQGKEDLYNEEK